MTRFLVECLLFPATFIAALAENPGVLHVLHSDGMGIHHFLTQKYIRWQNFAHLQSPHMVCHHRLA